MMVRAYRRERYYYDVTGVSLGEVLLCIMMVWAYRHIIMMVRAYRRGRYYYDGVGPDAPRWF